MNDAKARASSSAGRRARVERATKETTIVVSVNLDGTGHAEIATGVPFGSRPTNAHANPPWPRSRSRVYVPRVWPTRSVGALIAVTLQRGVSRLTYGASND